MRTHEIVHHADESFSIPTLPVTAKALERHAKRFGVEGIEEIAVEFGIGLPREVMRKLSPKRQTTISLRQQVTDLSARGVRPGGIANVLNISERRVRALLKAA